MGSLQLVQPGETHIVYQLYFNQKKIVKKGINDSLPLGKERKLSPSKRIASVKPVMLKSMTDTQNSEYLPYEAIDNT